MQDIYFDNNIISCLFAMPNLSCGPRDILDIMLSTRCKIPEHSFVNLSVLTTDQGIVYVSAICLYACSNGRTDVECEIKEALNIKSINPTLNQNLFQHGSSFLINVFK